MGKFTTSIKPSNKEPKMLNEHSQRAHALLSASGSKRWINCTPSAKLEEAEGPRETSIYAAEGTLAHELSELYLRHDTLLNIDDAKFNEGFEAIMSNELFSDEMLDVVPIYVDYCTAEYKAAKTKCKFALIEIEQKLDLTEYVPEAFGTADCCIISDDILEVIDLKYGKGVPVYSEFNTQLMLYGLGALRKYSLMYDINKLKLTIVQPRINNISSWEISVDDLIKYAEETIKPAAQLAFKGEGELKAGSWCKFCVVKNKCRALYDENLKIAKHEFAKPEFLTDDDIADILKRAPMFIEWVNSIKEYAEDKAINEQKIWPGFKLVEGTSRRKWSNEDDVANAIYANFPEASDDQLFDMRLKSITAIEKLFGKKRVDEVLSNVIIKPQGKPTLVSEDDKRPALGLEDAIKDFR
jgi:hypothetical protein